MNRHALASALTLALAGATTACGQDVVLGQSALLGTDATAAVDAAPADAATVGPDAASAAFVAGPYALSFGPGRDSFCEGALIGLESSFDGIVPTTVSFTDGEVALVILGANTVRLDGPDLIYGFGTEALVLQRGLPDTPPELFVASARGATVAGPEGTELAAVALALDATTVTARGIEGSAFAAFDRGSSPGDTCTLAFLVTMIPLATP